MLHIRRVPFASKRRAQMAYAGAQSRQVSRTWGNAQASPAGRKGPKAFPSCLLRSCWKAGPSVWVFWPTLVSLHVQRRPCLCRDLEEPVEESNLKFQIPELVVSPKTHAFRAWVPYLSPCHALGLGFNTVLP